MDKRDNQAKGRLGEDAVCALLEQRGHEILARNYHRRCGEVDVISKCGGFVVFTEVKARKRGSMVSGLEAVDRRKQVRIILTADLWLTDNDTGLQPISPRSRLRGNIPGWWISASTRTHSLPMAFTRSTKQKTVYERTITMNYRSTRNSALNVTSAHAITKGLSDEGGLYVPESIPQLSKDEILAMCDMSYADRAFEVFSRLLTDFTADEIRHCVDSAYNDKNFDSNNIAELAKLIPGTYVLELWHGPTCAFKDMALQILPYLLTTSAKKTVDGKQIAILVATSGDTGKAALEGFKDVDGTSISVFYPEDGVSKMQKRQMTTQEGKNVNVCAVKGNFDDCQNGVKAIFTDKAIADRLAKNNILLSSANSINWGRLAPQIVYYVSTYAELLKNKEIEYGEKINVVVPTGNFGNILAAYYAKLMGIPVNKLICASNSNNVLTDFINTGVYDRNRKFYTTVSPSMDILISSNLERLLYHLSGDNDAVINDWFGKLKTDGRYEISADVKAKIGELFWAGCCSDAETKAEIKSTFENYNYLLDTHTAVAVKVYEDYKKATGDDTKTVIASTANPYKFSGAVYEAIGGTPVEDEWKNIAELEAKTGTKMPAPLAATKNKEIRFTGSVEKQEMPEVVCSFLKS